MQRAPSVGPGKNMAWFVLDSNKRAPELVGEAGNNADLRGELIRLTAEDGGNVFFLRHDITGAGKK